MPFLGWGFAVERHLRQGVMKHWEKGKMVVGQHVNGGLINKSYAVPVTGAVEWRSLREFKRRLDNTLSSVCGEDSA